MRDIQKVIAALASPIRREILSVIWDREVPAGEIAAVFDVTKPTISQHLAVLREAGLVSTRAVGPSRRYRARQEVLRGLHAALGDTDKWRNADDVPERALSQARTTLVVVATAEVETDQETTFRAFTDPSLYSRWMGVPVTLEDGRFACTLEWGTQVRGRYEVVVPSELIVMAWNFEDDSVPVPGADMTAYLRVRPLQKGARVEVHQLVESRLHADFMEGAWTLVLGRLKERVAAASAPGGGLAPKKRRAKRRAPAVVAKPAE